ncbi:MAG: hypothetical protein GF408_02895 [Candidatus Omnitrophica bacterium]|nr:hypothetical protein [Candidatus Omnitrophota bacterium]
MTGRYIYKKRFLRILFTLVDALGYPMSFPARAFRGKKNGPPRRILLIRADHIGDVVASTAVIKPLRESFPSARIDFMVPVWARDIIENDPGIDSTVPLNLPWFDRDPAGKDSPVRGFRRMVGLMRRGRYDAAIDLRGDFRHIAAMAIAGIPLRISYGITGGGFLLTDEVHYDRKAHETRKNLDLLLPLGVTVKESSPAVFLSGKDGLAGDQLFAEEGIDGDIAVIHPFPGHCSKAWDMREFGKVIEFLASKGFTVLVCGGEPDRGKLGTRHALSEVKDICGKTSLGTFASVCSKAGIFIGVDSGPAHIAAAVGTPSVILFSGVNSPGQWAPKGGNVSVICPGEGKGLEHVAAGEVCGVIDDVLEKGKSRKEKGKNIGKV